MSKHLVFVSSPLDEFAQLRHDLCYSLVRDDYFRELFDVFLFEDLPAQNQNPEGIYLDKVRECAIYLGVFGATYGAPGDDGVSATEKEFDCATAHEKDRIVFVKRLDENGRRDLRMQDLIVKASQSLTYKEFRTTAELKFEVMRSLLLWLKNRAQ